ncbi:MAG: response regulator [Zetaproteobacteria bacterium CG_4_9_14_3_um_filter_49_83]|nr:MAG: response regulator [Zetaproteobacteria bacterium CG1_02_49_23]PIQ31785.1 MAG: response regulator [Zetaproteobacteria bacterium CG17_big_fil_post_rev_8_21_14_2_50_50_13]PIV31423.1 MAG: response regulator [Zetaproteobacteria bacterium CG02_land_8_20_14_3_00_50_9]PIY56660.1 MAG: response regulator [Zetaproteobacteria bacterium CG_4_10_14_0_8_um_filter_49_80]PJA34214.1 MAG: response regulator [Zetaproteobacteria bacterium CG_4_9_14_3_um_filter_49_83]
MKRTVLVVDDNEINRLNLKLLLKDDYEVLEAGDLDMANEALATSRVDLVVLDLALPPEPDNPEIGMAYLAQLRQDSPDTLVVVITGHDEHELAHRARELGALDFFGKPFDPDEVHDTVDRAMESRWQSLREEELKQALESRIGDQLLGDSDAMFQVRHMIEQVAPMPTTVLIRGETGTGKELAARHIHALSTRSKEPFITINCASMASEHLETELFGHEKGAFAGAVKRKLGWFERANGGTLFLDEVACLPMSVQGKLLRVLERGQMSRLGGDAEIRCNVRLICSTQVDLEEHIRQGTLRDDLYYRIQVLEINMPPLRDHLEDIEAIARRVLQRKSLSCGKRVIDFSPDVFEQMQRYSWPGNVRELENVIERAVVLSSSELIESLPSLAGSHVRQVSEDALEAWFEQLPDSGIRGEKAVAEFEKKLLLTALDRNGGIKARAGRWLGFGDRSKDKMRYLCDKYGVELKDEG